MREELTIQLGVLHRTEMSVGISQPEDVTAELIFNLQQALDNVENLIEIRRRRAAESP